MSTLSFDGDVIVVTGAGGGMGRTHALELARRGARVVVNDLGGHPFGGGEDTGLAEAVVQEILAEGGEAVANTASLADFDDLIDVNLRGTMRTVQPAYKAMRAGGVGRIVTVTSSSGMLGAHFQ